MKTCNKCGESKPTSEFYADKTVKSGLMARCKPCHIKLTAASSYKSRHGMTQQQVANVAKEQGGCAICGSPVPAGGRGLWVVDHDHRHVECTRRKASCPDCRRGVLCANCNSGLGMFNDNPQTLEAAIMYLDKWAKA